MAYQMLTGVATAGNANMDFVVPTNEQWRVISGRVIITTDATVANRFVRMALLDTTDADVMDFHAGAAITASLTSQHLGFMQGIYRETAIVDGALQVPIGHDVIVPSGWTLRFYVQGGVAGDSFTSTVFIDNAAK